MPPASQTSTRATSGVLVTMTVIVPPGRRESLCMTLLVASSLASRTGMSAHELSPSVAPTNSRTARTCPASHGTVRDARIAVPAVVPTAEAVVLLLVMAYRPVIMASGPRKPWRGRADSR